MRWARSPATIVAILPTIGGMESHFHAWLRSGRVFTMVARPFADRTTAHRWATKQRPDKADRLVLGCTECPPTRPSKRRPPRWATVARQVAAAVGAEPAAVRAAIVRWARGSSSASSRGAGQRLRGGGLGQQLPDAINRPAP